MTISTKYFGKKFKMAKEYMEKVIEKGKKYAGKISVIGLVGLSAIGFSGHANAQEVDASSGTAVEMVDQLNETREQVIQAEEEVNIARIRAQWADISDDDREQRQAELAKAEQARDKLIENMSIQEKEFGMRVYGEEPAEAVQPTEPELPAQSEPTPQPTKPTEPRESTSQLEPLSTESQPIQPDKTETVESEKPTTPVARAIYEDIRNGKFTPINTGTGQEELTPVASELLKDINNWTPINPVTKQIEPRTPATETHAPEPTETVESEKPTTPVARAIYENIRNGKFTPINTGTGQVEPAMNQRTDETNTNVLITSIKSTLDTYRKIANDLIAEGKIDNAKKMYEKIKIYEKQLKEAESKLLGKNSEDKER